MIQAIQQAPNLLRMVELLPKDLSIYYSKNHKTKNLFCGFFVIIFLFYNLNEILSRLFHTGDLQLLLDD